MGRRIGRKRLYSLNKVGQSVSSSVAPGVSASVGHRKVSRQGQEIVTEITVDLGFGGAGLYAAAGVDNGIIGYSGSHPNPANQDAAHLGMINRAENGIVTTVEMICTETAAGGDTKIQLAYNSSGTKGVSSSAGTTIIHGGTIAAGTASSKNYDANELEQQFLYLQTGQAKQADRAWDQYTAGKLIIRLYGWATPDDL